MPKVFIATPIDVIVSKIRENCPTGNRWNHALFRWPKNNSAPSQTVATAQIAPKVCHGQPPVITGRVKAIKTRLKVFPNPILGEAIASRQVIIFWKPEYCIWETHATSKKEKRPTSRPRPKKTQRNHHRMTTDMAVTDKARFYHYSEECKAEL